MTNQNKELFVAPDGNDSFSGFLPEQNAAGNDGPLRSPRMAIAVARQLFRSGQSHRPVVIRLRGGRYPVTFPILLRPEDSGTFRLCAFEGEQPILDGGVRVAQWRESTEGGPGLWEANVSSIVLHHGAFRSVFAGTERLQRARYPLEGHLWTDAAPDVRSTETTFNLDLFRGSHSFRARPGDLDGITLKPGAEVVMLNRWVNERLPLASHDPAARRISLRHPTRFILETEFKDKDKTTRYWIENVREGLARPGTWFLDTERGTLLYSPLPGQAMDGFEVVVPVTSQILRFEGDLERDALVRDLTIDGIGFEYADWEHPSNRGVWWDPALPEAHWKPREGFRTFEEINGADLSKECGTVPQAAFNLPGVIHLQGAERCTIANCTIAHVGFHGIALWQGCRNNRVLGNRIYDMGAGGVLLDGTDAFGASQLLNEGNVVSDNTINSGGHVFLAACGVVVGHASAAVVSHNEIYDMTYSGISCGWMWGFYDNPARCHRIDFNHIHHIGQRGGMSDLGGIYLLGPQPGTSIRGNYLHDIEMAAYGGWGIYLDEGSAFITLESNIICRTASEGIMEHMGRQNVMRGNLIVHPRAGGFHFVRHQRNQWAASPAEGGIVVANVVITRGAPIANEMLAYQDNIPHLRDLNIYWDEKGSVSFLKLTWPQWRDQLDPSKATGLPAWRELSSSDLNSRAEDPGLTLDDQGNPSLANLELLKSVGFTTPRHTDAGPRRD